MEFKLLMVLLIIIIFLPSLFLLIFLQPIIITTITIHPFQFQLVSLLELITQLVFPLVSLLVNPQ